MSGILSSIEGLGLNALLPLVGLADPDLSQLISDLKDTFAKPSITLADAQRDAHDLINELKKRVPKFAMALDALSGNIDNEIPKLIQAEQIAVEAYPMLRQTFELFKNSQ